MNHFKYKSTTVMKSEFDFTNLRKGRSLSGSAEVASSIGIPKDLGKNKTVRCMIEMRLNGENNDFQIYIKTLSDFDIENLENKDTLLKDAKDFCAQRTMAELSDRLDQLLSIQLGEKINVPIPPFTVE